MSHVRNKVGISCNDRWDRYHHNWSSSPPPPNPIPAISFYGCTECEACKWKIARCGITSRPQLTHYFDGTPGPVGRIAPNTGKNWRDPILSLSKADIWESLLTLATFLAAGYLWWNWRAAWG